MDTMIANFSSTGLTNLLIIVMLILLYRVVRIMKWSKITLTEIQPKINLMAEIENQWKARGRDPRSDGEIKIELQKLKNVEKQKAETAFQERIENEKKKDILREEIKHKR